MMQTAVAVRRTVTTFLVTASAAFAQSPARSDAESDHRTDIRPILARYCFRCHGEDEQKGDVRLDTLDPDMVNGPDAEVWGVALDMLHAGDMPPSDELQPADAERRALVAWLTAALDDAAIARQGERKTVMRRLTKAQYTNTLQELLGLSLDFGKMLPDDGKSRMGFSNDGEVLQVSPLHLDYYQSVARMALGQAIAIGERPTITRYRATFGTGIGVRKVAGTTGGYQSVPLGTDDFVIDILDAAGRPRSGVDEEQQRAIDAVKRHISIGLRGSSQDRFRVVDEGLLLFSALPHKERAPGAWQGPSPNVKLEMQRCFPETGDFVMRVRASRGHVPATQEQLLVALDEPVAIAALDDDGSPVAPAGALVLRAAAGQKRSNLVEDGDALVPVDVPKPSSAQFQIDLARDGFYQVDLVHPVTRDDAMRSVRLSIDRQNLDLRPRLSQAQRELDRVVTPIGVAVLRAGRHQLRVGGPFFSGFSHVVVTALPADHPMVVRLSAQADELNAKLADRVPVIRAYVGTRTDDGMDYATFDEPQEVLARRGAPQTYSFFGRLENLPIPEPESGDKEILSGFMLLGLWNDHLVKAPDETGPPLLVESIEFEAPYLPIWPPESHTRIFFDSPHRADEETYTREVLAAFMERAFRRPVGDEEVDRYVEFWKLGRSEFESYEASVREALVAVLCSPNFLFLAEPIAGSADAAETVVAAEHALAARLSYFLWNSPPDATLRELARAGRLCDELARQVERMLDDPRTTRMVRAFSREWLRMDRLDGMTINVDVHPDFTRFVKRDMAEETYRFVEHVIREDLDIFTLIDSDFAMLNQNLAEFYGIGGVVGPQFRPVPVGREQHRGGLLSQGAFLSGHSDGTQPHPIKRAVWLKAKILGDPPPPPPPNVPALDPETPGFDKLTLKQQLEAHRNRASCVDCHARIDPWGIAFERYSAVGRYEATRRGIAVDAVAELPDGTRIDGVDELKAFILDAKRDVFAASLIEHLFAYALGRDIHFADRPELDAILEQTRNSGYRMRAVIRAIVSSPSFRQS